MDTSTHNMLQDSATDDDDPSPPTSKERVGYLCTFGVSPTHRNNGIGEALLSATVGHLLHDMHLPSVWLHCLAADVGVVRFYEKRGFVKVQLLENFYHFPTEQPLLGGGSVAPFCSQHCNETEEAQFDPPLYRPGAQQRTAHAAFLMCSGVRN